MIQLRARLVGLRLLQKVFGSSCIAASLMGLKLYFFFDKNSFKDSFIIFCIKLIRRSHIFTRLLIKKQLRLFQNFCKEVIFLDGCLARLEGTPSILKNEVVLDSDMVSKA